MKYIEDITILSCNFNNTLITGIMLKSLKKQLGFLPKILIMDNGNISINEDFKNVFNVFENNNSKITGQYNQISKNHCSSIDYALKNLIKTKYVLLCDNDILFKPKIKELLYSEINEDVIGEIGWDDAPPNRLFPYMCIINVEKFKKEKINYFDNNRCIGPGSKEIGKRGPGTSCWYKDTGCSFYEDIKDYWNILNINLNDYILHLKALHTKNKNIINDWLNKNKELFI